jgi:hypothetical protein
MRTTVDIPDPVYRRPKSRAAIEGTSAKELILRGVQEVLNPESEEVSQRNQASHHTVQAAGNGRSQQ